MTYEDPAGRGDDAAPRCTRGHMQRAGSVQPIEGRFCGDIGRTGGARCVSWSPCAPSLGSPQVQTPRGAAGLPGAGGFSSGSGANLGGSSGEAEVRGPGANLGGSSGEAEAL